MRRDSNLYRLRVAGATLVFAAVIIAGAIDVYLCAEAPCRLSETTEASMQTTPGRAPEGPASGGQDKPTVSYWHVWTDENGVSHQNRCELSAFRLQSISASSAPEWIDKLITSGATVLVVVQPVGWVGEWHENPKPQWIVPLSGRWFVKTMDGTRVEMGPGEASFGNDQHCKADAQGRKGHRSGTVGNQPSVLMIVQLEQDPATDQSCRFK
jgi:hypothetical protein